MNEFILNWLEVFSSEYEESTDKKSETVIALDLDSENVSYWEFVKDDYSEAVLDPKREKYVAFSLSDSSFDASDFATLAEGLRSGKVVPIENLPLQKEFMFCYDSRKNEYVAISTRIQS